LANQQLAQAENHLHRALGRRVGRRQSDPAVGAHACVARIAEARGDAQGARKAWAAASKIITNDAAVAGCVLAIPLSSRFMKA
jgi:hypothetical protein